MRDYELLSVRDGEREPDDVPFEGVTEHLHPHLKNWLKRSFFSGGYVVEHLPMMLALRLGVKVDGEDDGRAVSDLLTAVHGDETLMLDAVDLRLRVGNLPRDARPLEGILALAGSVWTVNDEGAGLVRRVDATARATYQQATSPDDEASTELREAWSAVYGLHPNESDAWDHAIKAVEHVTTPVVVPNMANATLGNALGELRARPDAYESTLGPVTALIAMLELVCWNPDRHGNEQKRTPTPAEAEAIVQVAVTLVQWLRTGFLRKL